MTKRSTRWATVARNLADAKQAALDAAAAGDDGGTCNMDHVFIRLRWSKGLEGALADAGVRGRRAERHGRACVVLSFGDLGQANGNARGCMAAAALLRTRSMDARVFFMVD